MTSNYVSFRFNRKRQDEGDAAGPSKKPAKKKKTPKKKTPKKKTPLKKKQNKDASAPPPKVVRSLKDSLS
jgi:hypothetical protein